MLAGSITEKQDELLNLAYASVRKRVADALMKLSETYKKEEADNFIAAFSTAFLEADVNGNIQVTEREAVAWLSDAYHDLYGPVSLTFSKR